MKLTYLADVIVAVGHAIAAVIQRQLQPRYHHLTLRRRVFRIRPLTLLGRGTPMLRLGYRVAGLEFIRHRVRLRDAQAVYLLLELEPGGGCVSTLKLLRIRVNVLFPFRARVRRSEHFRVPQLA